MSFTSQSLPLPYNGAAARLTDTLELILERQRVPGLSVAVVRPGGLVYSQGFGRANLSENRPMRPSTRTHWFSMTKLVTATAVMRLAEEGRLHLDAPVTSHVPELAHLNTPVPITPRHLLNHTSGLPNPLPVRWVHAAEHLAYDSEAFASRQLSAVKRLNSVPGREAKYSNLGYLALGRLISAVSGRSFESYLSEQLLQPLGMAETGFGFHTAATHATGYHQLPAALHSAMRAALPPGIVGGRAGKFLAFNPFQVNGPAYGGLIGSALDAARFAQMHLNEGELDGVRLVSPQAAREMQSLQARGRAMDVGLGWFRYRKHQSQAFVEHLGGGAGYWTMLRLYPQDQLGIVLMGNATGYDHHAMALAIHDHFCH